MSMSLAPHPIGIKYWTNLWRTNKDLSYAEIHSKMEKSFQYNFHRRFGRFFYMHRAGAFGALAPLGVGILSCKVILMWYGAGRDREAAYTAASAYGQGGYKTNPTPK